jgi:hypothetical protein
MGKSRLSAACTLFISRKWIKRVAGFSEVRIGAAAVLALLFET